MSKKSIKPVNSFPPLPQPVFNFQLRTKYIFLALTGFIFYVNSIFNKYAFDDGMAIEKNAYVQMGFKGIPKILTNDSWASYYNSMGGDSSSAQLSGGRYRPLSEIIFAVEQQLFGDSILLPYFRHLVNILAYVACILAIFYFLEKFLLKKIPSGSDIAFLATFLFVIHPLHTEVVANIKSLDEILSLLFIMLTFIYGLKYLHEHRRINIIIGIFSFLLALLSKEYAITLIFFIPFLYYLLEDKKPLSAIMDSFPYYGVILIYLLLRYIAVGFHSNIQIDDVISNPYLYATHGQKVATEWFVLGKYLGLLFFPYPLSFDYSYYQITYHNFSDVKVIATMLIYLGILILGIILTLKKNILSFALFFFLFNILVVSNFVIDIGAAMGERLAFHSSLGFVIIFSYCFFRVISKMRVQTKKGFAMGYLSVIGIICFGETVHRNSQWSDDTSLFIHDVGVVPNSCLANDNAGWRYLVLSQQKNNSVKEIKSYSDSAKKYLLRALYFNASFYIAYNNLGDLYFNEGLLDSALHCYKMVEKINFSYPDLKSDYASLCQLYFAKGLQFGKNGNYNECLLNMKKALLLDSTNADIWYSIGMVYRYIHQNDSARYAFIKTLQYKPDSSDEIDAKKNLQTLSQMK